MKIRRRAERRIGFSERVATAFVAVFAAIVTLSLYPLVLFAITRGAGGDLSLLFYGFMLSKVGIAVVVGAGVVGFCLGGERMANIFSFFWGTHGWWNRAGAYLDDKAEVLRTEYNVPLGALAIFLLVVFVLVVWKPWA